MNRGTRFVDTGYWIALVNDSDRFHDRARALNEGLSGPLISTEAILIELGNTFSRQRWRALGIALIAEITQDPRFEIVPLTSAGHRALLDARRQRMGYDRLHLVRCDARSRNHGGTRRRSALHPGWVPRAATRGVTDGRVSR